MPLLADIDASRDDWPLGELSGVMCRACRFCVVVLACELAPGVLAHDIGLCMEDSYSPVDIDEPRAGADAECWEPR